MAYLDHLSHDALLKTLKLKKVHGMTSTSPRDIAKTLHKSKSCTCTGYNKKVISNCKLENVNRLVISHELIFQAPCLTSEHTEVTGTLVSHFSPQISVYFKTRLLKYCFPINMFYMIRHYRNKRCLLCWHVLCTQTTKWTSISRAPGIIIFNYEYPILSGFRIKSMPVLNICSLTKSLALFGWCV